MDKTTLLPAGTHQVVCAGSEYDQGAEYDRAGRPLTVEFCGSAAECKAWLVAEGVAADPAYWVRTVRLSKAQRAQIERSAARAALLASFCR